MKIFPIAFGGLAGLLLSLLSLNAAAQVSPALDRFSISAGVFSSSPQISAQLGGDKAAFSTGVLDGKRQAMPRLSAEFLVGDNHGISFDAYRYRQGYSRNYAWRGSDTELTDGGTANLELGFDLDVARLGYRYWWGSGNTVLGLGAGIGYYRVSLNTQISGTSDGKSPGDGFNESEGAYRRHDSEAAFAPMLELGLRHAVNSKLRLFADASGVYKGGSGVHGGIYNAAAGVEWLPVQNFGVSLAYAVTDVDLKRDAGGLQRFRVRFNGPVLSVKARF